MNRGGPANVGPPPARHRRQAGLGEVRRLVDLTQAEVLVLERAVEALDAFGRVVVRGNVLDPVADILPTRLRITAACAWTRNGTS